MIVIATWPEMRIIERRLGGRRGLAVAVMTLIMLALILVPVGIAVFSLVDRAEDIAAWTRSLASLSLPALPEWVTDVPVVGKRIAAGWQTLASMRPEDLASRVSPYLVLIVRWLIGQAGSLLALFVHLLRAIALGIVVTALIQSVFGGIGLAITGVPHPALLTAIMFLLGVAQIGAVPVLIGAVIWLYWQNENLWGTVMLVWSIITGTLDNVVRPFLIKQGADLPLLLVFAGVLGGLLAFGIIGPFVGPVVLAVSYTLLVAWLDEGRVPEE